MLDLLKLYFTSLAAFLALDMLWLGVVARGFYRRQLGFVIAPTVNWPAAIVFYLLFNLGLLVFVVLPGLAPGAGLRTTLLRAALFGLVTYATYDLTNLATLKDWPLALTLVDLLWGTLLSTAAGLAAVWVGRWLRM